MTKEKKIDDFGRFEGSLKENGSKLELKLQIAELSFAKDGNIAKVLELNDGDAIRVLVFKAHRKGKANM